MKKECVNCHNNHPESPKSDWKVGDLRGILEVIIPIQSATLLNNEMVYKTAYLLVVTLFISLLCIAFVLRRLHISNNKYEKINKTLSQEVSYRKNVQNELLTLASIDPLTGIANRREFERVYDTQWLSAVRNQKDTSIIMIDINYYKSYNDNYRHQLGDEILHVVAKEISQYLLRPNDLVAR
jgi:predicted signal transduction protein with EAL and GGDEF domain